MSPLLLLLLMLTRGVWLYRCELQRYQLRPAERAALETVRAWVMFQPAAGNVEIGNSTWFEAGWC